MTIYAVIQENQINNVIVADNLEIAESVTGHTCVELPEGFMIGDLYDGKNFTKLEVINNLTQEETTKPVVK